MQIWYLFFFAIITSTTSMVGGIGGAVLNATLLLIGYNFPIDVAIGSALITEIFGLFSGFISYYSQRVIDFVTAKKMLVASIPAAFLGTLIGFWIPNALLTMLFSLGLLGISIPLFHTALHKEKQDHLQAIKTHRKHHLPAKTEEKRIPPPKHDVNRYFFATTGGLLVATIAMGLTELTEYYLALKTKLPNKASVATSLFVLFATVIATVAFHLAIIYYHSLDETLRQILAIITFTIPGALIGGQLGPRVIEHLEPKTLRLILGTVFVLTGTILLLNSVNINGIASRIMDGIISY